MSNFTSTDEPSTGRNVLAFFIPIVGWIMYFAKRDETPVMAKEILKWSWIGFAVNFFINLLVFC